MAVFEQERHVELVAGANQLFSITNRMVSATIPAQLPHLNVFVINIVEDDDPKQDTLARVATLADLTEIPIGRDAGITAPGPDGKQFLSPVWTATYETLEEGLDAAQAFRDRVNKLITDWVSFRTNFNAPDPSPAQYTFPAADTSQKTVLIAAYTAAKQDRYQKQLAKTEADAVLARAQADYTYKQGLVSQLSSIVSAATQNATQMSTASGYFATLKAAGDTFAAANPTGVGILAFQTALTTAAQQHAEFISYIGDATALSTSINTYLANRQADVVAAQTAVNNATTDQATKVTQLTAAQALEASTLAAVLAVCPDFDKNSIPFVPDTEP